MTLITFNESDLLHKSPHPQRVSDNGVHPHACGETVTGVKKLDRNKNNKWK